MRKSAKRTIENVKSALRSLYKRWPIHVIIVAVLVTGAFLGSGSYIVYSALQPNLQADRALEATDSPNAADQEEIADTNNDTEEQDGSTTTTSTGCSYTSSLQVAQSSYTPANSITIGGPERIDSYPLGIRSSSGEDITHLKVSTSPSFESASDKLELPGLQVWEKPSSFQYAFTRFLYFKRLDNTSSGNVTVYVFTECDLEPVAIDTSWSPHPELSIEKTSYSKDVTGNVELHTFDFDISHIANIGTAHLEFQLKGSGSQHYYSEQCGTESMNFISTPYDGTTSFTLTCKYTTPLPSCPYSPSACEPYFSVYANLVTDNNKRVASDSIRYDF